MVHGFRGYVAYPRGVDGPSGRGHDPQCFRPVEFLSVLGHVEHETGVAGVQCREPGSERGSHAFVVFVRPR